MHELSIANAIIDQVTEALRDEGDAAVSVVRVRIGAWSGVVAEALDFAWTAATPGSRVEGSQLEIEKIPGAAWCPRCQKEVELEDLVLRCPVCGESTPRLLRGMEMQILNVELNDEQQAAHP
ncbi:MAG: hydrogenase maturation nickel metallochaperone HypA [Phycisphaeraceae bacterium]|nr:hydrogenase maturation nickel metallochaperone HypA [Phycisphaeraceae bacterium]